jgi:hypothetical protein
MKFARRVSDRSKKVPHRVKGAIMAGKYEITSKKGDIGSLGFTTTARVRDTETGKTGEVHINSGTPQDERDRIGDAISEGDVDWDDDDDD